MKYRPEIDGLRALAVLPVVLFHAGFEWFGGGFIGVDVFFVISGYLITTIIISEMSEDKFSIINFYERRARRILPALFFIMMACIPFAWLWLTPTDLKDFGQSLFAVSIFSSNILFWLESGYFDTASELKPLLHTWSLAIEEQFYILFPLFLIMSWRLGIKWILFFLLMTFLLSIGFAQWNANTASYTGFYLLPARAWELLVGVFIAFYLKYRTYLKSHIINQVLSFLGFMMIIYSIVAYDKTTPFPSYYTLIPTIGTGLLIMCAVPKTFIHKLLTIKIIVGIGLISYSAYLWHQPLLAFAKHRSFEEISDFVLILLCISSFILAWFSWQFIEKPFRDKNRIGRRNIFLFSVFGILLFSFTGFSMHIKNGYEVRVQFSDELSSSFERPSFQHCYDQLFSHSKEQWGCNLGSDKGDIDFILFGDSHSLSLKSIIDEKGKQNDIKVFYIGISGCLPFIGVYPNRHDQYENNCYLLNERVFNFAKDKNIRGIILASRWSYYAYGDYNFSGAQLISDKKNGPFTLQNSLESFTKAFKNTVQSYNSIEVPIHLITQPPHQKYQPESAYFWITKGIGSIEMFSVKRSEFEKLNDFPINTFSKYNDKIYLHNITDLFCDEFICPIGTQLQSFYYDADHISDHGANKISPVVENIFTK